MTEPRRTSLKRDFGIFLEPGFLTALILVGILSAGAAAMLVYSANKYGIPLSEYWR
jgi:hypothetical protein